METLRLSFDFERYRLKVKDLLELLQSCPRDLNIFLKMADSRKLVEPMFVIESVPEYNSAIDAPQKEKLIIIEGE